MGEKVEEVSEGGRKWRDVGEWVQVMGEGEEME